jgi:flagellar hook-length control protein FliK
MMNPLTNFNAPLPSAAVHVTGNTGAQHNDDAPQRGGFADLLNLAASSPTKAPAPMASMKAQSPAPVPAPSAPSAPKRPEPAPHQASGEPTNETTHTDNAEMHTAANAEPAHPVARRNSSTATGAKAKAASSGKAEAAPAKASAGSDAAEAVDNAQNAATDNAVDGIEATGTIDPMVLMAATRAAVTEPTAATTGPSTPLTSEGQAAAGTDPAAATPTAAVPGDAAALAAASSAAAGAARTSLGQGSVDQADARPGPVALDGLSPVDARPSSALPPGAGEAQAALAAAANAGFSAAGAAGAGNASATSRVQELEVTTTTAAPPTAAEGASPNTATAAAGLSFATGLADALAPKGSAATPATAEVRVATPVNSPEFAPALGLTISTLAAGGVQEARLQLHPAELGPITVQIALDGTGARIDFQADVAQTRQAIEASLPALAGALQDAGLTLTGGGVSQQSQHASRDPSASGRNGSNRGGNARDDLGGMDAAAATTRAPQARRSLVDLVA